MALQDAIYKEFEDVVGPENITKDPVIMHAYHATDFAAVVLPKNTEEVQALVKLCNKHKVPFRAVSTGWTIVLAPGTLYIDLRRMNKIIEINEKNMYAVVEPYVIAAELQAETMKRGFIFCMKGSGAHGTAFLRGHGHMDQSTGADDRSQLAIEWVTPEGELVRVGSPGSSDEWFTGDGPGPSLRSLISSSLPPGITPGVFTKSALKLYHWQGPSQFPLEGVSPRYKMKVPSGFMARYYSFKTSADMYEAEIKIGRSEIAFELMGFSISMVASNISTSNEEEAVIFEKFRKLVQGPGFYVIISSDSPEEFEYKKKVLNQIIRETNGKSLEPIEEDPDIEATLIFGCTRITHSIRETFRAGGAFNSIPIMGQRDLTLKWVEGASVGKREMIKKGLIVDDAEAFFGWGVEYGHLGKSEIFCRFDPATPGAREAVLNWRYTQNKRAFDENYFAPVMGVLPTESIAPRMCNYTAWMEKFGKLIDPNRVQQRSGDII